LKVIGLRRNYGQTAAIMAGVNHACGAHTANLPHTQEYLAYLDRAALEAIGDGNLGTVAEPCCGRGEAVTFADENDFSPCHGNLLPGASDEARSG
jgi:hypothetical protein